MIPGQLFGLGCSSDRIDLFCRVESIETNGDIRFRVINGAWYGHLCPKDTMVCYSPHGNTGHQILGRFLDQVPKFRDDCYNEAIAWMNGELTEDIQQYLYAEPKDLPASWNDDIPF